MQYFSKIYCALLLKCGNSETVFLIPPSQSPNYAEYKFNDTKNIIILLIIIHSHKMSVKNTRWPEWLILFEFFRSHYQDLCTISTLLICIFWIHNLNFTKYYLIILTHSMQKIAYPIASLFHFKSGNDRGKNKRNNIVNNFVFVFTGMFCCLMLLFLFLSVLKILSKKVSSSLYGISIISPILFQAFKIIL